MEKIAIIGSAGIPAEYGGFETLAEQLAIFTRDKSAYVRLMIVCSSYKKSKALLPQTYCGAELVYVRMPSNGFFSIFYDGASLLRALLAGYRKILILGVSGTIFLPIAKLLFPRSTFAVNLDGVESRRAKWNWLARAFLGLSERLAIENAQIIIADNQGIADHVKECYGVYAPVISYGGDHAISKKKQAESHRHKMPERYALAICRIEPENNVELILRSFVEMQAIDLVVVGNWNANAYGRRLRDKYASAGGLSLLNPIYDIDCLFSIRKQANIYIHGHSAGGTNPSLVEIMHLSKPVIAFDCSFNRYTTFGKALYFSNKEQLIRTVKFTPQSELDRVASYMGSIAATHYTWNRIGSKYLDLLLPTNKEA